ASTSKTEQVTLDDIDSFSRVRQVPDRPAAGALLPESTVKRGFAAVIGERGTFNDWGGEQDDLYSTQVRFRGRRVATAVAFKGPGTRGVLTLAKMGKNGDQVLRLFRAPAALFVVEYHGQIHENVIDEMSKHAVAKSAYEGR